MGMRVGDVELPDLPSGWPVAVDSETSGTHPDGEPFTVGSRAAGPPARISVVSVSFRQPLPDGSAGEIVDYAWPFDQGPVLGKPALRVIDPDTKITTFKPIDHATQAKMLANASKVLGFEVTPELACPNLPPLEYARLVKWLDARDTLVMHNSVFDLHMLRVGLRAGAGGYADTPEGFGAWDADSEPGTWTLNEPQVLNLMEPVPEVLTGAQSTRSVWCTMVTQKQLIDPLKPAALKATARRLWGDDSTDEEYALKAELSKQGTGLTKRYDLLSWAGVIGEYAAADTRLTLRLYEYQLACVDEGAVLPKFWALHQAEMELRTTLYRMECRGVAFNADAAFKQGAELRERNAREAAEMPFDPSKPAEARRFYFGPMCPVAEGVDLLCADSCPKCGGKNGLGLEPTNRTEKTGQPQLDIEELRRLVDANQPWAAEYMAWTKRRNADSKWYTGWAARVGVDGQLRTSFKQCKNDFDRPGAGGGGTKSGRLAVGRVQLQAMPTSQHIPPGALSVKGLIGNEPDYELYEHDLAAGEIRVATVLANVTSLWDALDAGADIHAMNTRALFNVDDDHPQFKQLRNAAKRATFGFLYLGGVNAIHEQVEATSGMRFSKQAVKDAKDRFWATYPEFQLMADQAVHKVTRWQGGCGYLKALDGWRRWYAPEERTISAVNQAVQTNLARAAIYWMLEIERRVPGCLLLQVHDSVITRHARTPEGAAEAQLVSDIGNAVFERYFGIRGRVMKFNIAPERWADKG